MVGANHNTMNINNNSSSSINNNDGQTTTSAPSSASSSTQPAPGATKTCILHKDERGFGLKVSGSNPVFVAEVKAGGSAEKAGVKKNDIIFKVNGNLATKWPHEKVVQLIQGSGGPYVCLTLIVPPPAEATSENSTTSNAPTAANNNQSMATTNGGNVDANKNSVNAVTVKAAVPCPGFESVTVAPVQVVQNIIPKHLAESSSSMSASACPAAAAGPPGHKSNAPSQQQDSGKSNVSISCPFPLVPPPFAPSTTSPGRGSDVGLHGHGMHAIPGRKGSAPGGMTITAPLPASPEVQAGLEKSRDKTLRSMIKTQKAIIITLKAQEESARKESVANGGNQDKITGILSKMEEAENTIKVFEEKTQEHATEPEQAEG